MVEDSVGVIAEVRPGTPAREMGLEPGDRLLEVNGKKVSDYVDYRFETCGELVELTVQKTNGEQWVIEFEKDYDQDLGIVFANDLFDGLKECKNACVFCFLQQMPKGMRKSLYVRDDDYRLSFLHGNFITLTNLSEAEFSRIIDQKLSPMYISVHATNPDVRQQLMKTPKSRDIMGQLRRLADAGIDIHAQLVLCPGLNDGPELNRSIRDLETLGERVLSIAAVPVGLTKHRKDLQRLRTFTREEALGILSQVAAWQRLFLSRYGRRIVHAADEFYVITGKPVPSARNYEGFPQLQNGIGLIRLFTDQFKRAGRKSSGELPSRRVTVVTGRSAAPTISKLLLSLEGSGISALVLPVRNEFFGETVTVTGLLTAKDIISALISARNEGQDLGEEILLPEVVIRDGEGDLLDGLRPGDIASAVGVPVRVVMVHGGAFFEALTGVVAA